MSPHFETNSNRTSVSLIVVVRGVNSFTDRFRTRNCSICRSGEARTSAAHSFVSDMDFEELVETAVLT